MKPKDNFNVRLGSDSQEHLNGIAAREHTNRSEAIRRALKWTYDQRAPAEIKPQITRPDDVDKTIVVLGDYIDHFGTVARNFYPEHYDGECAERTQLVDEFRVKSKQALHDLPQTANKLRVLAGVVANARDLDLTRLRGAADQIWFNAKAMARRCLSGELTEEELKETKYWLRQLMELLRLLDRAGVWHASDFVGKSARIETLWMTSTTTRNNP